MKQEKLEKDWTEQLREKLADHEEPAPAGLWEQIEARMAALEEEKRQSARRIPLWGKWVAAAAFAGMLVGNTYLMWLIGCENTPDNNTKQELVQSNPPMKSEKSPVSSDQEAPSQIMPDTPAVMAQAAQEAPEVVPSEPEEVLSEPEILPEVQEPLPVIAATTVDSIGHIAEPSEERMTPQQEEAVIHQLDEALAEIDGHHRSHGNMAFGLYAANDLGTYQHANGVRMSREMLANYYAATRGNTDNIPENLPTVYLYNYEERQKHYQPLSFGLTAKIPISSGLSLSSGLVYTRLRSDFTNIVSGYPLEKKQTLHYLGIPLNAHYHLGGYKGLKFYVSAGGQVDFCIDTKVVMSGTEVEMDNDRPQWSVQGALGVQYNVIPMLGFYVEPGMKHYFNNHSRIRNFFKDKPTNFNLQIGLRLNVGN